MKKAVCVLLQNPEGKYLCVSRKDDHTNFSMPGGKVDPGEFIDVAVVRETKEETGLTIDNLNLIYTCTWGGYNQFCFSADYTGPDQFDGVSVFDPEHENHVIKWGTLQDLMDSPTFGKYNREMFENLNLI